MQNFMLARSFSDIQKKLVQWITDIVPENQSLVDILADVLQISTDSAYRRIRGETSLDIQEVALVCDYFKISFDSLCANEEIDTVSFRYKSLNTEADYIKYLLSIRDDIQKILASKGTIIYAAEDIPLFHHFRYPDLAAFKIFYWIRSIISDETYRNIQFHPDVISDKIKEICKEIFNAYTQVESIEIWTEVTAMSLIMQLKYFWDSGIFEHKEIALHICQLALEEVSFIEKQAEASRKLDILDKEVNPEVSYTLYHSDIEIGNNTIIASVQNTDWLYLTHNTLNKMVTANKEFCAETKQWLSYLMQKSTLISGVAEKQRYQFFRKIYKQLEDINEVIKAS
jgi:hypothetical protein